MGPSPWSPAAWLIVSGSTALRVSMALAVLAYRRLDIAVGVNSADLRESLSYEPTEGTLLRRLLDTYAEGVDHNNDHVIRRTNQRISLSLLFLILAVTFILAGTMFLIGMGANP